MSDKRIGNTTNSIRNSEVAVLLSKAYSEEIQGYRKYADGMRKRRKYKQEAMTEYYDKLGEYLAEKAKDKKSITLSGIWLKLGVNKDFWSKAKNGEYDYLLYEYMDINGVSDSDVTMINDIPYHVADNKKVMLISYSDFVEKVDYLIQDQLESGIYTNKGNQAGYIFGLKNLSGWRDDGDTPLHVVNNTLNISGDQALKAMKMLIDVEK